ncbi:MAG: hypothetical protein ACJA0H_001198 [Francisellaceae bacterium]|jgi:uncharacterized protein (DUF1778 family)
MQTGRIEIKTEDTVKSTLEKAAGIVGVSLSSFLIQNSLPKAKKIINDEKHIKLSDNDFNKFLEILDNPPEPNQALINLRKKR